MRELSWAATGRQREAWNHTSAQIAQHAELNRDPKKRSRPFSWKEFHPLEQKRKKPKTVSLDELYKMAMG